MFEIRRVFQQSRVEISKVNEGQFSVANVVKELGHDQLIDNVRHMLSKEVGRLGTCQNGLNLQHNPADYLIENF